MAFKPVCGDDRVTYANQCAMERQSCFTKKIIRATKSGSCGRLEVIAGYLSLYSRISEPRLNPGSTHFRLHLSKIFK